MKKIIALSIISVVLFACSEDDIAQFESMKKNQKAVLVNQQSLEVAFPPPKLTLSLERKNLIERLERINAQNMTGCIYLLSYGSIMSMYPVRGKVTSLNAFLNAETRIMNDPNGDMSAGSLQVEQPDYDGAYGKNDDGIFFFTADSNAYVEWKGDYLWSDQCLKLSQQPALTRELKD